MSIRQAVSAADADFLTALANKGLYNRALRELPEAGVRVETDATGEKLRAEFADGTVLTLEGSIRNYACSCPSRAVCKHLLMAVLAAQSALSAPETGGKAELTAATPPDFSQVANASAAALSKLAGAKALREAVLESRSLEAAEITVASVLTVTLPESGMTVRFLPGAPLAESTCDCKEEKFCRHRLRAVLQYIIAHKGALPEEFWPNENENASFGTEALAYARDFIVEIFRVGLARLPEDGADRFSQLAAICHGHRLANMERLASRIAGHLRHYEQRSAVFRREILADDLCALLLLEEKISAGAADKATVGVFRDSYLPLPPVFLTGLGAYGWESPGGYTGVTVIMYSPDSKRLLRYTSVLRTAQSSGIEDMYKGGAPWGLPLSLAQLGQSRLRLTGGRANATGQLSASAESRAELLGPVFLADPALDPLVYENFATLLEAIWRHRENSSEGERFYALLKPAAVLESGYDRIAQVYTLPLRDLEGRILTLKARYEPTTKLLLDNLTELEPRLAEEPGIFLVSAYIEDGRLVAFPLTHYGESRWDLGLERKKQKTAAAPRYDWGI
ncbi:MAG: SWIM zinc finger family protein [Gracilibacteraceae bacterium]|jgi:hypothetical protein|nr:SWIM zinc finger family protein [Gracilibacteraceae bacterium]